MQGDKGGTGEKVVVEFGLTAEVVEELCGKDEMGEEFGQDKLVVVHVESSLPLVVVDKVVLNVENFEDASAQLDDKKVVDLGKSQAELLYLKPPLLKGLDLGDSSQVLLVLVEDNREDKDDSSLAVDMASSEVAAYVVEGQDCTVLGMVGTSGEQDKQNMEEEHMEHQSSFYWVKWVKAMTY